MWVFIVLIPDHGLSIYHAVKKYRNSSLAVFLQDNKLNKNRTLEVYMEHRKQRN